MTNLNIDILTEGDNLCTNRGFIQRKSMYQLNFSSIINILSEPNAIRKIMEQGTLASFNLAGGWGDYPPHCGIKEAIINLASDKDKFHKATRYSESGGLVSFKRIIAEKLAGQIFGQNSIKEENIVINAGSTPLGYQLINLFCTGEKSRPLLVTDPIYVNYLLQAKLLGISIIKIDVFEKDGNFLPSSNPSTIYKSLEGHLIKNNPGALIIVSPCNPTGYIWPDDVIDNIFEMTSSYHMPVILDRAYCAFYFNNKPEHFSWTLRKYPNLISIESFSKTFSLLGSRLGYVIGQEDVIKYLTAETQRMSLCPDRFEQQAMTDFLSKTETSHIQDYLADARRAYHRAYMTARETILKIYPKAKIVEPDGGFYLLLRVQGDDDLFSSLLMEKDKVLVVPGRAFGKTTRGWIRTAFAPYVNDHSKLIEAYSKLAHFLNKWEEENA